MSSSSHPCPTPLMLFHGLMSSPQEFGLIAHALRSKGLRHEAPSVPGYTHAPQQMAPNWRGWRTGAREQLEERALGDGRVVIGGLCMGGILAAAAALEAPERVAGLVLLSPSFEFDGWGLTWLRHLRHLAYWTGTDRFFAMKERAPYGVKNEKIRRWIKNELEQRAQSAAGPARVPLPALRQAEQMLAEVKARLHELRCPILVIHAREDEVSSLAGAQRFFDSLPQADKELVVLENSYHMVTIDNDRSQLSVLLDGFVRRISAPPVPAGHPMDVPVRVYAQAR
jgi:carboxylesterase